MKLDHYLTPYTKINSKLIKDLNVRLETIKLLNKNTIHTIVKGNTHSDVDLSNIFLDMYPQVKETKAKINKWTTSN